MKFSIIVLVLPAFMMASCNQEIAPGKVPSVVVNTLRSEYNPATDISWTKNDNAYEAEFKNNGLEVAVLIDPSGKLVMDKQEISIIDIPSALLATLQEKYKGYIVDEAEMLKKDNIVYYQVELEARKKKDLYLVLSSSGEEEKKIQFWD